ncbi:MAG: transposase [Cyanobacteria bacterium P01_H01_bin.153]
MPEDVSSEAAQAALKRSKYALLKPEETLTDKPREKLAEVKTVAPKLAAMHEVKEAFRAWFKTENEHEALFALFGLDGNGAKSLPELGSHYQALVWRDSAIL